MTACLNMLLRYSTQNFGSYSDLRINAYPQDYRMIRSSRRVKRAINESDLPLKIAGVKFTMIERKCNKRSARSKIEENDKIPLFVHVFEDQRYYSTKQPYPDPANSHILSSVPEGFYPIGVELLARHGSRTLTNNNSDEETLRLWKIANEKNLLTEFGQQLKPDVQFFIEENNKVGRGELTYIGRSEHRAIGTRLGQRLRKLFDRKTSVSVLTSGKKRAIDSAEEFISALIKSNSSIDKVGNETNKNLLYFHKSCEDYLAFKNGDTDVQSQLHSIKNLPRTRFFARLILRRIYKEQFVEMLSEGKFQADSMQNENESLEERLRTKNEVDVVLCLYSLFSVSMAHQSKSMRRLLAKYFTEEESNWFSYVNDAEEFYIKGPSIDGKHVTHEMARPLLNDFFSSIRSVIDEDHTIGARLRFAHAETVIPFATLLQIPGFSDQTVNKSDLYTYETNNWRGHRVSPMAANIQWEIYRHKDDSRRILIRMLYNEIEVNFKAGCKSWGNDSFFYEFEELKRAYGQLL